MRFPFQDRSAADRIIRHDGVLHPIDNARMYLHFSFCDTRLAFLIACSNAMPAVLLPAYSMARAVADAQMMFAGSFRFAINCAFLPLVPLVRVDAWDDASSMPNAAGSRVNIAAESAQGKNGNLLPAYYIPSSQPFMGF